MATRSTRKSRPRARHLPLSVGLTVALLLCAAPALPQNTSADAQRATGTITGTVADDTGSAIADAQLRLSQDRGAPIETTSGLDGRFSFSNIPPSPFRLTVSAPGFADRTVSDMIGPGEILDLPIRMTLALGIVEVQVAPTITEIADRQIKEQEQQRILGVLPNFFVTYDPNAVPLNTRQKFELSWKSQLDPVRFGIVAAIAGVQQARNDFKGFGDGPQGYGKRYAAAYANILTHGVIVQVLLPSVLKQDPRYFFKGTGSTKSRFLYAISRAAIKKGDNGRWQPNYSGILGNLAAGGISNLYYPAEDRRGIRLTLENAAIGIGGAAAGYLAQEFLLAKLTFRPRKSTSQTPSSTP